MLAADTLGADDYAGSAEFDGDPLLLAPKLLKRDSAGGTHTVPDLADLLGACFATESSGLTIGASMGVVFDGSGSIPGGAAGFVTGCQLGILSEGPLGYSIFFNYNN